MFSCEMGILFYCILFCCLFDSDFMLPNLLNEDKKKRGSKQWSVAAMGERKEVVVEPVE